MLTPILVEGGGLPREGSFLELGFLSLQALYFLPGAANRSFLCLVGRVLPTSVERMKPYLSY